MQLGVCYYPEHWPRAWWASDAMQMKQLGLSWVRIAEFAWSRIEPTPGHMQWAWLDEAIETLHAQGLQIVLGTPTCTPPKWLVDAMPDMVPVDAQGHRRGFGSRRHYCFSHLGYRREAARITADIAKRYGQHPAVQAWQVDNEYDCHDTVLSYSEAARQGFRQWLQQRYGSIEALNQAWGTVFWSQEYSDFAQIELPNLTVTEANPSQRLDFQRYSSAQVVAFHREQVHALRAHSDRPISHNFMGFITGFDHHALAQDLDIATWDSYPLGHTLMSFLPQDEKLRYAFTGHPDLPAFHHDLYRGMCAPKSGAARSHGRWWVMEQQPGPVNWARWNPCPAPGMVKLWAWQAFAHGAEVVSYFRWRQAHFAQEQNHAGLQFGDRTLSPGGHEVQALGAQLAALQAKVGKLDRRSSQARVALLYDYDNLWITQIQPQGEDYLPLAQLFAAYSALRQWGLDVDVISSDALMQAPTDAYALIVAPASPHLSEALMLHLQQSPAHVVLGARSASKTANLHQHWGATWEAFCAWTGVRVRRVASLAPGMQAGEATWNVEAGVPHSPFAIQRWVEELELLESGEATPLACDAHGAPLITCRQRVSYVGVWLDTNGWHTLLGLVARRAGLSTMALPPDVRVSRLGDWYFACNFSSQPQSWAPPQAAQPSTDAHAAPELIHQDPLSPAQSTVAPYGVALWRVTE